MSIAQFIPLAIKASISLIVFGIALSASLDDLAYLLRKPGLLVRSLLAMNVVMPVLAVLIAVLFNLNPIVEVALIALSLSPVPPILPNKQLKAGGAPAYTLSLLTTTALVSVVFVPGALEVIGPIFGRPVDVDIGAVATIVFSSVLAPLLVGIAFRRLAPSLAPKLARPVSTVATVLLVLATLPIMVKEWPAMVALVGHYSIVAILLFCIAGLAVGHLLGGPDPDERTVLGLSTAARHPAIALAIAHRVSDPQALLAAVLLVVLVSAIVSIPYVWWRARVHDGTHPQHPAHA
jgi:BASS family bile acid:Na+ symporter